MQHFTREVLVVGTASGLTPCCVMHGGIGLEPQALYLQNFLKSQVAGAHLVALQDLPILSNQLVIILSTYKEDSTAAQQHNSTNLVDACTSRVGIRTCHTVGWGAEAL
jgi:hypothetical protein